MSLRMKESQCTLPDVDRSQLYRYLQIKIIRKGVIGQLK